MLSRESVALAVDEERVKKPRLCGFPDDSSCDNVRYDGAVPLLLWLVWLPSLRL